MEQRAGMSGEASVDEDELALPSIDPARVSGAVEAFIAEQLERAGFERVVLGLSGGIDSATVAQLCARVVGAGNLLAIRMPYRTSSPDSETDAKRVIEALGCRTERIEISPMVDPMLELISGPEDQVRVRAGNVMARQRMIVVYDRSAAFGALVAGTGNRTEALLGYGTLHGDMAAAFGPIGGLYKTEVRALAEHLGVPRQIIDKPPSADLWPGQTDEGELGARYADLDRVLHALVDRGWSVDRCVSAGVERPLAEWVARTVERMAYKLRQPAVAEIDRLR